MLLTNVKAHSAKPASKPIKLPDGGGLYLEVRPSGAKLWRYRYRIDGKENVFAIGEYYADKRAGHVSIEGAASISNQIVPKRIPWNKARFTGPKPPLKAKQVWSIRTRLQVAKRTRDLALFDLAIDSKLRGCDLVRLKTADIALPGVVQTRTTVIQRKTGRPVQFEITEQTRTSVHAWLQSLGLTRSASPVPDNRPNSSAADEVRQQGYDDDGE